MSDQPTTVVEDREQRRPLRLLLGVLAAVVVLGGLYLLVVQPLLADDGATPTTPSPAPTGDEAAPGPAEAPVDEDLAAIPTVTYEVFLARDPFDPVVPEPTPVATEPLEDAPAPADDPAGDDPAGCTTGADVVCDGRLVTLIEVTRDADGQQLAVIQIDTTVYEVARGETFAGAFQVRSIDGGCVSILHGDDGFQLCQGDRVLK